MAQMLVMLENFDGTDDTKILIFGVGAMIGVGASIGYSTLYFFMCT